MLTRTEGIIVAQSFVAESGKRWSIETISTASIRSGESGAVPRRRLGTPSTTSKNGSVRTFVSSRCCAIEVDDEPGPESQRATVERGSIALLSNYHRDRIDPRKDSWLGAESDAEEIRLSGLWNINHVEECRPEGFFSTFESYVENMKIPSA